MKTTITWDLNTYNPKKKNIQNTVVPTNPLNTFNDWINYIHNLNNKIKYGK